MEAFRAALLRANVDVKPNQVGIAVAVGALTVIGYLFVYWWLPYLRGLEAQLEEEAQEATAEREGKNARAADDDARAWQAAEDIGLTHETLTQVEEELGRERVREMMRRHGVRRPAAAGGRREGRPTGQLQPRLWYKQRAACSDCFDEHPRHLCCQAIGTKPRLTSHLRPAHTSGWSADVRQEFHTGELQLITWGMALSANSGASRSEAQIRSAAEAKDRKEEMGWGGVPVNRQAAMQRIFADECADYEDRSLGKFHDLHPEAFRWTCCGLLGDAVGGCEHHGPGCSCDYCRAHVPAPYTPTQANRFLRLANSPTSPWRRCTSNHSTTASFPWMFLRFVSDYRADPRHSVLDPVSASAHACRLPSADAGGVAVLAPDAAAAVARGGGRASAPLRRGGSPSCRMGGVRPTCRNTTQRGFAAATG